MSVKSLAFNDSVVGVGSGIVERERRDRRKHRVKPRTADRGLRRLAVHAALELRNA